MPDLRRRGGVVLLDPGEVGDRGTGEDEVRVLLDAVQGGAERRTCLLVALLPRPQPHRVDVRVPDHVQGTARGPSGGRCGRARGSRPEFGRFRAGHGGWFVLLVEVPVCQGEATAERSMYSLSRCNSRTCASCTRAVRPEATARTRTA